MKLIKVKIKLSFFSLHCHFNLYLRSKFPSGTRYEYRQSCWSDTLNIRIVGVYQVAVLCVMSHSWCGGQMATGARVEVRMGRARTAGRWCRPVYLVSSLQTPALLVRWPVLLARGPFSLFHAILSVSSGQRGWICSVSGLFHSEGINHLEWQQRKQLSLSCDKFE